MKPHRTHAAFAAFGVVLALAACGGSGSKPAAASGSALAISECMRAHGVSNFPDPIVGPSGSPGMSVSSTPGSSTITVEGVAFSGPAFQSAVKVCKLFGGGSSPPAISESDKLRAVAFARCMRANGVPNFTDPSFPSGAGIARTSRPDGNAPAVKRAAAVCNRG
jgi:hypothetical protein